MSKLQEDKMVPITIDLTVGKDQIDESFLRDFGLAIELIIKNMFGVSLDQFKIRGPKTALQKFSDALRAETQYARAFRNAGLNDPSVLKTRWKLESAIRKFEAETGIKWPLK